MKYITYTIGILLIFSLFSLPYYAELSVVILTTKAIIWMLFALSFNLVFGFGGMLSIGHAAFFGTGAYVAAILAKDLGFATAAAISVGVFAGALTGWVFAKISAQFGGFRFAMITLALGQLVWIVAFRWYGVTKGDDGYWGVPRPTFAQDDISFFYLTAVTASCATLMLWWIMRSPFGKILKAIRDNQKRVESTGVDSARHKELAFIVSAGFSALAGSLYAFFLEGATPELASWTTSAEVIVMSLLGGIGYFFGPAVGAFAIIFLEDAVSRKLEYWFLLLGGILMALVLLLPGGITGAAGSITMRLRLRGARS